MSGLKNTVKRAWNAGMEWEGYKTNKEIRQEKKMKAQSALNKIYQGATMPDAEDEQRKARKKAAGRKGSRVSTVLTNETLG